MIAHNLLELLIILVLKREKVFINSSIQYSFLHKKYSEFIQCQNKLLSLADFFLYITYTLIKKIYSILLLDIYLSNQLYNVFFYLWAFLLNFEPCHQNNHEYKDYYIIQKTPRNEKCIWLGTRNACFIFWKSVCMFYILRFISLSFGLINLYSILWLKELYKELRLILILMRSKH